MIASDSPFKSLFPIPVTNLNSTSINRQPSRFSLRFWSSEHKIKMEIWRKISIRFFPNRRTADVIKVEVDASGEDIFDPVVAAEANSFPDHLVIMVNGIVGSAADWRYAAEQFVKKLPDKVFVHCSECNSSTLTFDGVDMMGERLAEEVLDVVKRRPEVRKISFVAHSLGGLVARYAVGRLYEHVSIPEPSNHNTDCSVQKHTKNLPGCVPQPRIAGLEPLNFITVATPHLGSRGHNQLPLLCGLPFLERRAPQTAHLLVGRSGKHLFLTDNDEGKPPLLLRMANDSYNLMFISALRAFKRRVAYANANYDHMVGWRTSSIRRQSELPKSNLLVMDEKYPHIVYVERESTGSLNNRTPSDVEDQIYDVEGGEMNQRLNLEQARETTKLEGGSEHTKEMIRGLTQVPWERVDVSFQKSRQRYIAHSTIQVKSYWLNSDGADVVYHIIDNFLL